jgi:hypothetical protein
MKGKKKQTATRVKKLQERINSALSESPQDAVASKFSPYVLDEQSQAVVGQEVDVGGQLEQAASAAGGLEGIETALDEFDRLAQSVDGGRLRHALMVFLTHHPEAIKLGLRIPTLEERSPWKVMPGKKSS